MILRMPEYCREFHCPAGGCSDNCCIGWEIDIDEKTADYYMSVEGGFGEKLRKNISVGECYSFILHNERCPFLNDSNLCEIILNLGDDKLCHICDRHPRYFEWYDGIKEGGIGLCCEEAAKLILARGGENSYFETEIPGEECDGYDHVLYDFLYEAREKIINHIRNGNISLREMVSEVLNYTVMIQELVDNGETESVPEIMPYVYPDTTAGIMQMMEIFGKLEPIDEKWKPYIDRLCEKAGIVLHSSVHEQYIRNTGIYFIWRYFLKGVFDEEIVSKVGLAVISMAFTGIMFSCEQNADMHRCAELVKNYSKEIEYSEENLESIFDMIYTEKVFSEESLTAFFK